VNEELALAMELVKRWWPRMVSEFEHALVREGFNITNRVLGSDELGRTTPILELERNGNNGMSNLRPSLDDFMYVDRDVEPPQLDLALSVDAYAEKKMRSIIGGRIAILLIATSGDSREKVHESMKKLAPRFARLRLTTIEKPMP
jgi:hypothetical protein